MAYEETNKLFTGSSQDPIQASPPKAQADAIMPTGGEGGFAGTWPGFEDQNTPTDNGLLSGLTIHSPEPQDTSGFVDLPSSGNAGSWGNVQDTTQTADDDDDENAVLDGDMEPAPTDREQIIAEKMAYMPWASKTMFILFDTPVAIHWSFVLVLVVNVIYAVVYYKDISIFAVLWSLLAAIFWFLFVLINQVAHVIAAKIWKVRTCVAVCWMFGGYSEIIIAHSTQQHIKVSLAGPLSHLPWIVLFGFAATVVGQMEGVSVCYCVYLPFQAYFGFDVLNFCLWQNVWLFAWNLLLPCYPLDGALIMTCFLLERGYTPDRVLAIMLRISSVCFVGCILWSFFTQHLWAFLSTLLLLWNIAHMCWYLGRADRHPLFGLKTTEQMAAENLERANEIGGNVASTVAMSAIRSQASSAVNQNNAWTS